MIGKVTVLLLVCTVLVVNAAPTAVQINEKPAVAQILRYEYEPTDTGYRFGYETSDGQTRREEGVFKQLDGGETILAVYGSYSYIGSDGVTHSVEYISDENGYRPVVKQFQGRQTKPGVL